MQNRENQPLNQLPNLLEVGFAEPPISPEERDRRSQELQSRIDDNKEDAEVWFDSLPKVPESEKARIEKIILDSLDRFRIKSQRELPSEN